MSLEQEPPKENHRNLASPPGIEAETDRLQVSGYSDDHGIKFKDWGFRVGRLFEVAYRFYKRNESKAFHPSFDVRNRMNALILQARYGNFDSGKPPDIGVLDLVGKNRRHQWSLLKGMSKTEAMSQFICTLDSICPFFKAYAEAVKITAEPKLASQPTGSDSFNDRETDGTSKLSSEEHLQAIRSSLNKQTYNQFKSFAAKQYPDDVSKQKNLINSLQEQYYQQYMQMHPETSASFSQTNPIGTTAPSVAQPEVDRSYQVISNDCSGQPLSPNNSVQMPECQTQPESSSIKRADETVGEQTQTNATNTLPDRTISETTDSAVLESLRRFDNSPTSSDTGKNLTEFNGTNNENLEAKNQHFGTNLTDNTINCSQLHTLERVEPQFIGSFESYPEPTLIENPGSSSHVTINIPTCSQQNQAITKSKTHPNPTISVQAKESPIPHQPPPQAILAQETDRDSNQLDPNPRAVDSWGYDDSEDSESSLERSMTYEPLEQATLWSKKGVNEFKYSLADDKHGGTYVINQGTTLVIQVPTYPDGRYIHWEFATEDYDIGFGLDFVFEEHLVKPLALRIFEETDEEDDESDISAPRELNYDPESAAHFDGNLNEFCQLEALQIKRNEKSRRIANTVSIVPTYRRDSHEEIFVGRHKYPGKGYYMLKFDNTYSVLRSKTLYFRICYFV